MKTTIAPLKGANTMGLRTITVGGLLLASFGLCLAEEMKKEEKVTKEGELAPTTVIANRVKTDLDKVGSSVTVLDVKKLDQQGVRQLDDALKFVPGVISDTSSGQRGAPSSLFIRGNSSSDTGSVIDGIRMTAGGIGSGFRTGSFLGTSNILSSSRIELLKGPQGVIYGADSTSGILGISSAKGKGDFSGSFRVEGGSFDSWNTMLGLQGETGKLSYSLSLGHEITDNDLPNNAFEAYSHALRLDYEVSDKMRIGFTTRGSSSDSENPFYEDSRSPLFPKNLDVKFQYRLTSLFAKYDVNDIWSTKITGGYYDERYRTYQHTQGGRKNYDSESSKYVIYWDNTLTWNDQHTTIAGLAFDSAKYEGGSIYGPIAQTKRKQTGLYVNHLWDITEQLSLTAGARWTNYEDNGASGFNNDTTTWRATGSYEVEQTNTIVRASVGTGFQLPSFYQVYNRTPNNQINPAESLGWDFGIEQPFYDGQYKLGVTYFATRTENIIDYIRWDSGAIYENRSNVNETSGIEVSAKGTFLDDKITATIAYTWLDRQSLPAPNFLAENTLSARIDAKISDKLNLGLTSTYQGHRALYRGQAGTNPNAAPLDDYALVNLYANYKLSDNVSLNARVDNILDKEYFHGVSDAFGGGSQVRPGRGVGYFAGVTLSW